MYYAICNGNGNVAYLGIFFTRNGSNAEHCSKNLRERFGFALIMLLLFLLP